MPALLPPSMQIGAPMPGLEPSAIVGPTPGTAITPLKLVQQVAGNSTVAAATSLTLTVTSTGVGNLLVVCYALATSGALTVGTPPAGWTLAANTAGQSAGNTIAGRIYILPNNAGAITSVAISVLGGVNGLAGWFGEFSGATAVQPEPGYNTSGRSAYVNSSAAPSVTAYTPVASPSLLVGFETDVTGQAYTAANVGPGWVTGTTATSTNGATNAIIRPFYVFTAPNVSSYQLAGTLAGAIANGAALLSLYALAGGGIRSDVTSAQTIDGGAGYSNSLLGWNGWAVGGSKPGGNGGGQ